jgi:hypothetical protein
VRLRRKPADRREKDVRVLAGCPPHGSSEREADGILGDELDDAVRVLGVSTPPDGIVDQDSADAKKSIEAPDDERWPDVVRHTRSMVVSTDESDPICA